MNIWISITVVGAVLVVFGFIVFVRKYREQKYPKSASYSYWIGILVPLLCAFSYAETLMESFPNLTLIDLGAFYLIGMITGFFVALLVLQRPSSVSSNQS